MRIHLLATEEQFDDARHVEKVLESEGSGDVSIACWEPGQISPYHCHPQATEIYLCVVGGGTMRTPVSSAVLAPGSLVVHPEGELHEYENGSQRSVLFRVRYGEAVIGRELAWRGHPDWHQLPADARYFEQHPPGAATDQPAPSVGTGAEPV